MGEEVYLTYSKCSDTFIKAEVPRGLSPGYYSLQVINPDGQIGLLENAFEVTVSGTVQEIGISLFRGFNLLGICFYPDQTCSSAYSLFRNYFLPEEVDHITDPITKSIVYWEGAEPAGTDFELQSRKAYPVFIKNEKKDLYLTAIPNTVSLELSEGRNFVGPFPVENYTAFMMLIEESDSDIKIVSITRYNREKGKWEEAYRHNQFPAGADFNMEPGEGYIIDCRKTEI